MENTKFEQMKERATRRRDWVFSIWPYSPYAVLKNRVVWWAEHTGTSFKVYEYAFWFAHELCDVEDKKKAINALEYLIFNIEN